MDDHILRRLAFIRYGFTLAVEQSRQPEPMSAYSLLGFHDVVEFFLQLITESLNVDKKSRAFLDYWDVIDKKTGSEPLSQRAAMKRLNDARVALKHHGNLPSHSQVEQFRSYVSAFFEDSTPLFFGLSFDQISMIEMVSYDDPRQSLREAEGALEAGNTESAMESIAIAFDQLLHCVNQGYFDRYHRSPYYFGEQLTFDRPFFRRSGPIPEDRRREQFEEKLIDVVESMQSAVRIVSLGIDYPRYARFKLLTPVATNFGSTYHVEVVQGLEGSIDWPPTVEACRYCLDFVIESAVRIKGTDISLLPSAAS
jgi:hypothetical protein